MRSQERTDHSLLELDAAPDPTCGGRRASSAGGRSRCSIRANHRVLAYLRTLGKRAGARGEQPSGTAQAVELDLRGWPARSRSRCSGNSAVPAHRRAAVPAHAGSVRVLLVPAATSVASTRAVKPDESLLSDDLAAPAGGGRPRRPPRRRADAEQRVNGHGRRTRGAGGHRAATFRARAACSSIPTAVPTTARPRSSATRPPMTPAP